jgi:signal transduction histidine kinase
LRREWPVPVLVLAAIGGVLAIPAGLVVWAGVAILLSAYAVGVAVSRPAVVVSVSATAAAFVVAATLVAYGWWQGLAPMAVAAMPVGAAVGDAVRSRRALVAVLEERARRAEEAAELESRRRVAEERLRIARDVHDLVAHHIAVMNVQAGVAAHLLQSRPRAAAEALGHVGTAGRAVLDDLGTLLGLLRESGDPDTPIEPTPGLADLERLIDSAAAAGLRVDRATEGSPRPLPAAVEVSAYRVVQEALTNAHKHGTGPARLTLAYTPGRLRIEVSNDCSGHRRGGAGYGLIGMRERVTAVGGELRAGPAPGGRFVVSASVPVREEAGG